MASKHGDVYLYRGHQLRRQGQGWSISGPVLMASATKIREAYRLVDRAPGVQPKADKSAAGRAGSLAFWQRYTLVPCGIGDFAIVSRETGRMVNTLNGFNPFERK